MHYELFIIAVVRVRVRVRVGVRVNSLRLILFTASVAFATACAFSVRVEGVSTFAFKLTVFFHEHLYSDGNEDHCHDYECRNQNQKECSHVLFCYDEIIVFLAFLNEDIFVVEEVFFCDDFSVSDFFLVDSNAVAL